MQYYIARNGQVIGNWTISEIRSHINTGHILTTDFAWHEGTSTWLPVTKILFEQTAIASRSALTTESPNHHIQEGNYLKYPRWPWIYFSVFCFLFVVFFSWRSSLKNDADSLINEYNRINSINYSSKAIATGSVRALFDAFEMEVYSSNRSGDIKYALSDVYRVQKIASTGCVVSILGIVIFSGLGICKILEIKRSHKILSQFHEIP